MNLYEKQAVSAEEKHQIDDEKQEVEGGTAAVSYTDSYKSPLLTKGENDMAHDRQIKDVDLDREECGICGAVGDAEGCIDHKPGCFEKGEREYKEAMEKK